MGVEILNFGALVSVLPDDHACTLTEWSLWPSLFNLAWEVEPINSLMDLSIRGCVIG